MMQGCSHSGTTLNLRSAKPGLGRVGADLGDTNAEEVSHDLASPEVGLRWLCGVVDGITEDSSDRVVRTQELIRYRVR